MLKDFLQEDSNSSSSCVDLKNVLSNDKLQRRISKSSSTTAAALHRVSEIVVTAVRLPSSLLNRKKVDKVKREVTVSVKIKDILRWKSFRDLIDENPPPFNSPNRCTTTTVGSGSSSPSSWNGDGSSWTDSDFTVDYLPYRSGNFDEDYCSGEQYLPEKVNCAVVGEDCAGPTATYSPVIPTEVKLEEQDHLDQYSPVSVLDFPFGEDAVSHSAFSPTFASMEERTKKLMENKVDENTREHEANKDEEIAREMLYSIKATSLLKNWDANVECLLLDFVREELSKNRNRIRAEEIPKLARDWLIVKNSGPFRWGLKDKKEDCVKDMEREVRWKEFLLEQEELGLDMEIGVLSSLLDELLFDLLLC